MKCVSLVALILASSTAFAAIAPDHFLGQTTTLSFQALNVDLQSQICESIGLGSVDAGVGLQPFYPMKATWQRARANRYLGLGSCHQNDSEVKVLFAFNADATLDRTYKPLIVKNADPKYSCVEGSFAKSPAGEFFLTVYCDLAPDKNQNYFTQKSIYKLDVNGVLDPSFGQNGKIQTGPISFPQRPGKPGFLNDGTILDQDCVTSDESSLCTIHNYSARDGKSLGQKTTEMVTYIDWPFHFEDLADGILREETRPFCTGQGCMLDSAWGVSFGIRTFQDLLNREPLIDPRPREAADLAELYFTDGILAPFLRPETGRTVDTIDFLKFDVTRSGFRVDPEVTGPVRRTTVTERFEPSLSFTETSREVVKQIDSELDLNARQSEPVIPADPVNAVECAPGVKFGNGILATCIEYDQFRTPLQLILVAFDRNMRINKNFGDQGYLRPQGLTPTCLDSRFPTVEMTDEYLHIECSETEFNGDDTVTYKNKQFFFE